MTETNAVSDPVQDKVVAFIQLLYRHWYGLPPVLVRDRLDEGRHRLADTLAANGGADPGAAMRAVIDFALIAWQNPQARAELESDADRRSVLDINGFGFYLNAPQGNYQLKHVDKVVDWLGKEQPAETTIRAMQYIRHMVGGTYDKVKAAVTPYLDDFPAAERASIQETLSKPAANATDIVERLKELEKIDGVIPLAWRAFIGGKSFTPTTVLGMETAPPPAAAAAPPAANAPAGVTTQFYTDVRFPKRVKVRDTVPLFVRLTLAPQEASRDVQPISAHFPDPDKPELLEVVLHAPGFEEEFGASQRVLVAYARQDSELVAFSLRVVETGVHLITLDFYKDGVNLGSARFNVEVTDTGQGGGRIDAVESPSIDLQLDNVPRPADLEMRVVYDAKKHLLQYMLHSTKPDVGYHWLPVGQQELSEEQVRELIQESFATFSELARLSAADGDADTLKEYYKQVERTGRLLWDYLVPDDLKDEYVTVAELGEEQKVRTILVTTDEPWIPWEMIKPYREDRRTRRREEYPFLSESFQISRWLVGYGPYGRVKVDNVGLVVPKLNLQYAQGEGASFTAMEARHIAVSEPLTTKAAVLNLLRDGSAELLHFATHSAFNADAPNQSVIELEDGELTPDDLSDTDVINALRALRPIVFLNACESGRLDFRLSGLSGWAEQLVRQVRAGAFIGTLWEVRDDLAAEFSIKFYQELLDGQTIGESFHAARLHIKTLDENNPTWLAYTLYANPNTQVDWG